ncbi:phosphopantetheine adenylyltransferase [Actinokineospora pegani]|uniref:phosphopantetheine adenylyltransferase n=1 Tax=Actinokineospora pegani TaxID=2654637 RepID=UPI0012E99E60|nr:phosphopantetheine adenylyltransferase [Actinokineospora pegani]
MRSAYGVEIGSADLEVLLRHRAVLLALTGAFVIVSAFRPALRRAAITGSAVSMGAFLLLALTTTPVNAQVLRVAQVDAVALLLLAAGAALGRTSGEGA